MFRDFHLRCGVQRTSFAFRALGGNVVINLPCPYVFVCTYIHIHPGNLNLLNLKTHRKTDCNLTYTLKTYLLSQKTLNHPFLIDPFCPAALMLGF